MKSQTKQHSTDTSEDSPSLSKKLFYDELHAYKISGLLRGIISVILATMLCIITDIHYEHLAQKHFRQQSIDTMTEVSNQMSATVSRNVTALYDELGIIEQFVTAYQFGSDNADALDEVYKCLTKIKFDLFDNIGLLTDDGSVILSSGKYYPMSDEPMIREFLNNRETGLSCTLDHADFKDTLLFAIPYQGSQHIRVGRIAGILGTVSKTKAAKMLEPDISDKKYSYVAVADVDGNVIVDTETEKQFGDNLMDTFATFADESVMTKLREDFKNGSCDTLELMGVTRRFLTYYAPIVEEKSNIPDSIDNWRLMILTRPDILETNIANLFNTSKMMFYIAVALALAIMLVLIYIIARKRRQLLILRCTDPLTGLLNDKRFAADANLLIRDKSEKYAIASLNIVQFKMINDQIGREEANLVLECAGNCIRNFIRSDEIAARSFADRFSVLLNMETDEGFDRLYALEKSMLDTKYPGDIKPKFTIGLYRLKNTDKNIAEPLDYSRFAQSKAKENYTVPSNIVIYDEAAFKKHKKYHMIEETAESSLLNRDFIVYYHLKRGILTDNRWVGCEALVRWKHPEMGFLRPDEFIPLFEQNGFISQVDRYVFETVCADIRRSIDLGEKVVPVSVNISQRDLEGTPDFLNECEKIIQRYEIPRELIEFEVTETMAAKNAEFMMKIIDRIHALGCRCSLDDFGSGYSSFNMLQKFRFDIIKLDGSFFRGSNGSDNTTRLIIEMLIDLSHRLGMQVVAEGIESYDQVKFLKEENCDAIQGFYFAHPVPLDKYREMLNSEE